MKFPPIWWYNPEAQSGPAEGQAVVNGRYDVVAPSTVVTKGVALVIL